MKWTHTALDDDTMRELYRVALRLGERAHDDNGLVGQAGAAVTPDAIRAALTAPSLTASAQLIATWSGLPDTPMAIARRLRLLARMAMP
jgi:hypothetical protein